MTVISLFLSLNLMILSPLHGAVSDIKASDTPELSQDATVESEPMVSNTDEQKADAPDDSLPDETQTQTVGANAYVKTDGRRAIDWLAATQSLKARFEQIAPNGVISTGDLALQRPGRVRLDYDDPSPIVLVADGVTVAIADFDLETIDRAPISATPLRFLIGDADELEASGAIAEAGRTSDKLYVSLSDPEGKIDGRVTLVFNDADTSSSAETMTLQGWYALDAMGGMTEVVLSDILLEVDFNPRLFILDDEDVLTSDRRRRRR